MRTLRTAAIVMIMATSSVLAQAPDKPQPQPKRVVDVRFVAVQAAGFAGVIADVETSAAMLDRGCRETNPFMGSNPSRAKMYLVSGGIQAGLAVLSWYVKKKGVKGFWAMPALALGGAHGLAAWHNTRLRCR